ncbi:NADPH-dependent F420 reductase [Natronolimnobius baerhuensis]|uniref:NADPH-dependent F420 reductase n=1 Tax=Natronolimnobius baerhuensis TaxID=253108 RepID=A0A202E6G1_9EURY|nr:NADPH-dependent F420 reductase [Natronolimnobius baerhuensis]OVE83861.1 NADPH-dependent F420 reductase [Natronolimnobius baerhuensis]
MRLALLGGTGDFGEGLALRFARDTDHEILIGSRDPERAREAVTAYEDTLETHGASGSIKGFTNEMVADRADIVVLAVPPYYVGDTVDAIADKLDGDTILVSPAVGMKRDENGMHYHSPPAGSTTELVANRAPAGTPVVGTYHNLPANTLADLETEIDFDTPVVGDTDAVQMVISLTNEVEGLRGLAAGPLANAREVESLTPLVINITKYNSELDEAGVKWV